MRRNCGTLPWSRSATSPRSAICRSERVLQHRQPLPSSVIWSVLPRRSALSMPMLPNSLTTTAVPAPCAVARKRRTSVVFPAPRNPVTMVTGMRAPRARLSLRPNEPASREGKRSSNAPPGTLPALAIMLRGLGSKIHFQNVEPADVAVDGVDDLALVDEYVVELNGTGRRHGRRRRDEHPHFLRLVRIGNVVGAQPPVEEGAEHDLIGLPCCRQRHVLVNVVRPKAAGGGIGSVVGHWAGRDRNQVRFLAR